MGHSKICHNNYRLLRPFSVPRASIETPRYQLSISRGRFVAARRWPFPSTLLLHSLVRFLLLGLMLCATSAIAFARLEITDYEGRMITSVEVVFEGTAPDAAAQASLLSVLKVVPNTEYSAVRVRDSLQELFDTQRVANARVEVIEGSGKTGPIGLRFVVTRQVQ